LNRYSREYRELVASAALPQRLTAGDVAADAPVHEEMKLADIDAVRQGRLARHALPAALRLLFDCLAS
jgi:hypothetical protein